MRIIYIEVALIQNAIDSNLCQSTHQQSTHISVPTTAIYKNQRTGEGLLP